MKKFLFLVGATLVLGTAGTTLAQQSAAVPNPANAYRDVKDDNVMVPSLKRTVGQLDDMDVLGPDGRKVGEVEEVLMDASGQPVALVVDVEHGVGIGDKEIIVGLDQVRDDGRTLTTTLSNAQLGALPVWDD
ncbi:PRC-barrel domain-containing protein [Azospirillum isscasi]|uniref:PRC-barrel domain-containing protein n=1 Tax=Azospirillum isscasi TaxID=3053926 RepID=UPI0027D30B5F|nr:PRC-barrel domain-containing protein [Azospirillum isscasi]